MPDAPPPRPAPPAPDPAGRALFAELDELLCTAERPAARLEVLRHNGTLGQVPELLALCGVQQSPRWHPEGDVWVHTLMVVDEAARERVGDPHLDRLLLWGALCHDLGKPACTVFRDGQWRSPGHDLAGLKPTRRLLQRLTGDAAFVEDVCRLVLDHLAPHFYADTGASRRAVRRLLQRLMPLPLELLVRLGRADSFGRTTPQAHRRDYPQGQWLLERAAQLEPLGDDTQAAEPPLVLGRHLVALGYSPGPELGQLLGRLHEAQRAGCFDSVEGGLRWLRDDLSRG